MNDHFYEFEEYNVLALEDNLEIDQLIKVEDAYTEEVYVGYYKGIGDRSACLKYPDSRYCNRDLRKDECPGPLRLLLTSGMVLNLCGCIDIEYYSNTYSIAICKYRTIQGIRFIKGRII